MSTPSTPSTATDSGSGREAPSRGKGNIFARILLYLRQVIDELRKVVWPTRTELVQYTLVVLAFLLVIMAFLLGVDEVFKRLIGWLLSSN